jgi:hypothetical protein
VDVDEARSHLSVDWPSYFKSIRTECPWSLRAYHDGKIEICHWHTTKEILPLGDLEARVYILDLPDSIVEAMATELDLASTDCEWLFSYPGYGEYATPVKVLIQQHRARLNQLRAQLEFKEITTY